MLDMNGKRALKPYDTMTPLEKLQLSAAVRALLGVIWEQRARFDPKLAELPDDYLEPLGIPMAKPSTKPE